MVYAKKVRGENMANMVNFVHFVHFICMRFVVFAMFLPQGDMGLWTAH